MEINFLIYAYYLQEKWGGHTDLEKSNDFSE